MSPTKKLVPASKVNACSVLELKTTIGVKFFCLIYSTFDTICCFCRSSHLDVFCTLAQLFTCEFCEIFKNIFSVAASGFDKFKSKNKYFAVISQEYLFFMFSGRKIWLAIVLYQKWYLDNSY